MTRLADRDSIIKNALDVLRRPNSRRWQVFDQVNGKSIAPEIAKRLNKQPANVAAELAVLRDSGLVQEVGKRGNAIIYGKIPDLRHTNLRTHLKSSRRTNEVDQPASRAAEPPVVMTVGIRSRAIEKVLAAGQKLDIENIDQNYIDALVVLNFTETAVTKFLMNHGYSEDAIKDFYWNEKIDRLENKLFEEAKVSGMKPRTMVLTVLKQLRTQRNDLDHEAHLPDARIQKHEVDLILKTVDVFIKQVFSEHKKICQVGALKGEAVGRPGNGIQESKAAGPNRAR